MPTLNEVYRIICDNPGITSVNLNLELLRAEPAKDLSYSEIGAHLQSLIAEKKINCLQISNAAFVKTFYFPSGVKLYFS